MPRVSIIMNVRNGATTLPEAIDSALAQTFADWELIVWDDRSTDESAQIATEYRDPRIRYFLSPEETPLGKARHLAMRQAHGEWLAFLDQDDVWMPHKLEKQMALAAPGIGIIYGRAVLFDARRGNLRDYDYAHEFGPLPEGERLPSALPRRMFHRHEFSGFAALGRRRDRRNPGENPRRSRLLPVCRNCPPLSGARCSGTSCAAIEFIRAACWLPASSDYSCRASRCRSSISGPRILTHALPPIGG